MSAREIVARLESSGVTIASSLPDQWLAGVLDELESSTSIRHVPVSREEEGVGICVGAHLGGTLGAVVCQNAGLLLSTNALAGVARYHQVPMVLLVAYRGSGGDPYPYQAYKGEVTGPVLDALGIPHFTMERAEDSNLVTDAVAAAMEERSPAVVLMTWAALAGSET